MDDKLSVQKHIDNVGRAAGVKLELAQYLWVVCGEGIEKTYRTIVFRERCGYSPR